MNTKVYLWELDSVRNSNAEAECAQRALYRELLERGNTVIVTFNQIADSRWMMPILKEEKYYDCLMELFRMGAIKVSHYKNIRTASHYIQNSLDKDLDGEGNVYLFSGMPIRADEQSLLKEIKYVLKYCDPEKLLEDRDAIQELCNQLTISVKPQEIFHRITNQHSEYKNIQDVNALRERLMEDMERLNLIYRYMKLILLISQEKTSDNGPVAFSTSFSTVLQRILNLDTKQVAQCGVKWAVLFGEAVEEMKKGPQEENKRSSWYQVIDTWRVHEDKDDRIRHDFEELLIDLCYNYTLESSIEGVASACDLSQENTFFSSFLEHMDVYYENYCEGIHKVQDSKEEENLGQTVSLDWQLVVDIRRDICAFDARRHRLVRKNADNWEKKVKRTQIYTPLRDACIYGLLFCVLNVFVDWLTGGFESIPFIRYLLEAEGSIGGVAGVISMLLVGFVEIVVFGVLSSLLANQFGIPDILDICSTFMHKCRNWKQFHKITALGTRGEDERIDQA